MASTGFVIRCWLKNGGEVTVTPREAALLPFEDYALWCELGHLRARRTPEHTIGSQRRASTFSV